MYVVIFLTGGGGASAAISLDHFFQSLRQYYLGLRQEGAGPRQTPGGCPITPQEVEGLEAVLTLVTTIAGMVSGLYFDLCFEAKCFVVATEAG